MTAVDKHRQLNPLRPTKVGNRIQGSPDRTSGKQHIINKHNGLTGHIEVDC